MGGIAAGLQLINYKIDEMSFDHNINTAFILCDQLDRTKIRTSVSLRIPQKIAGKDEYICGLSMNLEHGEKQTTNILKYLLELLDILF